MNSDLWQYIIIGVVVGTAIYRSLNRTFHLFGFHSKKERKDNPRKKSSSGCCNCPLADNCDPERRSDSSQCNDL